MASRILKGESFWTKVEEELRIVVPNHWKFIFQLQSSDNSEIFTRLTESDLRRIENFVKSAVYYKKIPEGSNPSQYYGSFSKENFEFSPDDLALIKQIQVLIITKGEEYWKAATVQEANPAESEGSSVEQVYQCQWESSTLLNMLKYSFTENNGRDPRGHRFLHALKLVCSQIFMVGGRLLYDFLHANLPIPGPSTVENFMRKESLSIIEGVLRVNELKMFLESRNLPKAVWLSEDQTGISGRVQYDPTSNQIVGLVLPLNANSMPLTYSFTATSAKAIEKIFKNNKPASFLYTFMAQPLDPNASSFCLMVFGSDNKMTYEDVARRWRFMSTVLEAQGIQVLGFSGDGDTRVLKAMRVLAKLTEKPDHQSSKSDPDPERNQYDMKGFHAEILPQHAYVQDTVHIGNRLKNRLFKQSIILPLGNFAATSGDIQALVGMTTKDKHFLTETDLTLKDKMNFASTMRICHPRIWKLLKEKIPNSDGTQVYLKIVFFSMQSMLSTRLNPLERVYAIWFGVFFIRIWRFWIMSKSYYSVVNNCISLNSYVCLELNAHALLNLIFKCLRENAFQQFLPWLFSSQACENFFRNLRSMSSTFSTIVNCSVLDALHRLEKLQQLAELHVHDFKAERQNIHFPRSRFMNATHEKQEKVYPEMVKIDNPVSIDNIKDVFIKAKNDAWAEAVRLGINVPISAADDIQTDFRGTVPEDFCDVIDAEDIMRYEAVEENDIDSEDEDISLLSDPNNPLELPEFPENAEEVTTSSSKTVIKDRKGNLRVVKKSSICWYLSNHNKKLSSDRNIRVKECEITSTLNVHRVEVTKVERQSKIYIQDFCLFKVENFDFCLLGLISGFAYINEKNWKNLAYTQNYIDLEKPPKKKIGVFARWFNINSEDKSLSIYPLESQGYIDVCQYELTIPAPKNENGKFVISENIYEQIKSLLIV